MRSNSMDSKLTDIFWASAENGPARELFEGSRLRNLWEGENGAKAQVLEMNPGPVGKVLTCMNRGVFL